MIKVHWPFVYAVAIMLDITGIILAVLGIGLVLNRFIDLVAGPAFATYFYITAIKGWGWRLIAGTAWEEIPVLGDFTPGWTIAIWRIRIQNYDEPSVESPEVPETKEDIVARQQEEDLQQA